MLESDQTTIPRLLHDIELMIVVLYTMDPCGSALKVVFKVGRYRLFKTRGPLGYMLWPETVQ